MHRYVLERARADGCGVRLYVERTNTRAQATYKALGMDHSHYDLYEIDFTENAPLGGPMTLRENIRVASNARPASARSIQ